jgi:hypothetical protein
MLNTGEMAESAELKAPLIDDATLEKMLPTDDQKPIISTPIN